MRRLVGSTLLLLSLQSFTATLVVSFSNYGGQMPWFLVVTFLSTVPLLLMGLDGA